MHIFLLKIQCELITALSLMDIVLPVYLIIQTRSQQTFILQPTLTSSSPELGPKVATKFTYAFSQCAVNHIKRETKVFKITIIALSMFYFAWTPNAVLSMYCQYGWSPEKYVNRMASLIAAMFAKSVAIYNPIIYIYLNPDCWIYIKSIFSKKFAA